MERIKALLSEKYGYTQFRNGQEEIIQKVLQKQNVLGLCRPVAESRFVTNTGTCSGRFNFGHLSIDFLNERSG